MVDTKFCSPGMATLFLETLQDPQPAKTRLIEKKIQSHKNEIFFLEKKNVFEFFVPKSD